MTASAGRLFLFFATPACISGGRGTVPLPTRACVGVCPCEPILWQPGTRTPAPRQTPRLPVSLWRRRRATASAHASHLNAITLLFRCLLLVDRSPVSDMTRRVPKRRPGNARFPPLTRTYRCFVCNSPPKASVLPRPSHTPEPLTRHGRYPLCATAARSIQPRDPNTWDQRELPFAPRPSQATPAFLVRSLLGPQALL